ncbi:hypothetical protein DFH09DRAFT_1354917 [Mycena vulgaris]|nr:hypothetical protein DFH09DRAFT_1354917 [Mycena vulgaris]
MFLGLCVELLQGIGIQLAATDRNRFRAVCRYTAFAMEPLFFCAVALPGLHPWHKDDIWILESLATGETGWSTYAKTLRIAPRTLASVEKGMRSDLSDLASQEALVSALRAMKNIRQPWDMGGGRCPTWERNTICNYLQSLYLLDDLEISLGFAAELQLGNLSGLTRLKITTPWWMPCQTVQQVSKTVTQSHSLTTLHVVGIDDWSAFWSTLCDGSNSHIRLKDIRSGIVTADLLAYLASFSGIEKLSLQALSLYRSRCSRAESDHLSDTFFQTILPRHAETLVTLACPTGYESRWSFGRHNVNTICTLRKLTSLKIALNPDDVEYRHPMNTVDLLLRTVARIPSLHHISLCSAYPPLRQLEDRVVQQAHVDIRRTIFAFRSSDASPSIVRQRHRTLVPARIVDTIVKHISRRRPRRSFEMPASGVVTSDSAASKSARRAVRARIQEIDVQVRALQLSLKALLNERSSCEALLDAYKYPVLTLPTEITSEILLSFLPTPPKRPPAFGSLSPSFLCQICRDWRDVALATPAMWSAIHLDLDHSPSHPHQLWVLKAWLERSKECSLSVALHREEGEVDEKITTVAFIEALVPHCGRWADMLLVLPFQELRLIQGDMPRLRKVTVGPHFLVSHAAAPIILFDQAPNLTDVVLSVLFNPFAIVLPWSHITTLTGCLYANEVAEILRHTTRLERFSLSLASRLMYPTAVPPLFHLTFLCLVPATDSASESVHHLLDSLTLPALKLFQLTEFDQPGTIVPSLVSFLSRIHRLDELRVTRSRMPHGFYHSKFQHCVSKVEVDYDDSFDDDNT